MQSLRVQLQSALRFLICRMLCSYLAWQGPGKQELDELMQRYEAKRQQWRSPAWAAGGAGSAAGGSPWRRQVQAPLEPRWAEREPGIQDEVCC